MNLDSCYNCGNVVNLDYVQFIEMYPDEGVDKSPNGDYYGEINSDVIWKDDNPKATWECSICKSFNCQDKE